MKIIAFAATVAVCCSTMVAVSADAQPERGQRAQPAQPAQPPAAQRGERARPDRNAEAQPEGMSQAWREAMTPGEAHAAYDRLVGRWDAQVTIWQENDAEPMRSTGVARYEWVLRDPEADRGRYLRQEFQSELMGMPYRGLGYWGHDNVRGEYTSVWMDTMSTASMFSTGEYDEATSAFTFRGGYLDPDGGQWQIRMVLTIEDQGRHRFEYFRSSEGMEEHKGMEIVYTRARPGAGEERGGERRQPGQQPAGEGDRPGRRR